MSKEKIIAYKNDAEVILEHLKGGNEYLENRLSEMIKEYESYIQL